jgi:hypothetical protein
MIPIFTHPPSVGACRSSHHHGRATVRRAARDDKAGPSARTAQPGYNRGLEVVGTGDRSGWRLSGGTTSMAGLFGRGRKAEANRGSASLLDQVTRGNQVTDGWRFSLKGSPRFYDDVLRIIESDPGAVVYFGEALTYERGAAVALWRVRARGFSWLPVLYDWWADQERIEPVRFTFYLYIPPELKYPALDLRQHAPAEVEAFIKQQAPRT